MSTPSPATNKGTVGSRPGLPSGVRAGAVVSRAQAAGSREAGRGGAVGVAGRGKGTVRKISVGGSGGAVERPTKGKRCAARVSYAAADSGNETMLFFEAFCFLNHFFL